MSGKAMQEAVPPARTAIREMSRKVEESEGHFLELRPLLLHPKGALAEPKPGYAELARHSAA